ncbi:MAG: hypothetical protein WD557_16740 [Dehalococcoidia bacterium]
MSNESELTLQLDVAFDRLLWGDPIVAVEEDTERELIPFIEAFAALLEIAREPARTEFRLSLRKRFVDEGSAAARSDAGGMLGRVAAVVAAAFVVGSAINPALARNLVQSVSDTMGAEIAGVVQDVLSGGAPVASEEGSGEASASESWAAEPPIAIDFAPAAVIADPALGAAESTPADLSAPSGGGAPPSAHAPGPSPLANPNATAPKPAAIAPAPATAPGAADVDTPAAYAPPSIPSSGPPSNASDHPNPVAPADDPPAGSSPEVTDGAGESTSGEPPDDGVDETPRPGQSAAHANPGNQGQANGSSGPQNSGANQPGNPGNNQPGNAGPSEGHASKNTGVVASSNGGASPLEPPGKNVSPGQPHGHSLGSA